jgi:hypothetical protein
MRFNFAVYVPGIKVQKACPRSTYKVSTTTESAIDNRCMTLINPLTYHGRTEMMQINNLLHSRRGCSFPLRLIRPADWFDFRAAEALTL